MHIHLETEIVKESNSDLPTHLRLYAGHVLVAIVL